MERTALGTGQSKYLRSCWWLICGSLALRGALLLAHLAVRLQFAVLSIQCYAASAECGVCPMTALQSSLAWDQ
jgi:hypothetical protein